MGFIIGTYEKWEGFPKVRNKILLIFSFRYVSSLYCDITYFPPFSEKFVSHDIETLS